MVSFYNVGRWVSHAQLGALLDTCSGVAVDSGAFSVWNSAGGSVDWSEHGKRYRSFLREYAGRFDFAVGLDVIGDAEASLQAWEVMTAEGFDVVPVWHEGDPLEHLDAYGPADRLVGLGRTEGRDDKKKSLAFYDAAFNRHPSGKFHALGNARPDQLELYPFSSFDAVTWERNSGYAGQFGWPFSRCSKETRMIAHIEATESIQYKPSPSTGQLDLFGGPGR